MTTTKVSYADEAAIRAHYQHMLDSWGDAVAYAECFTPDADYIIANGMIEHGWKEIVDGHSSRTDRAGSRQTSRPSDHGGSAPRATPGGRSIPSSSLVT
ncbi:MAG: hypothetical protein R2722_05505 [Tessaracoccus sp.]